MSQGQYVATRPFPTTHRQYEIGDMIDTSRITSSELNAGVTSGAIEPAKFIDTAARLAALNPVLGPGVHAYETDTGVHKIGTDGVTRYNDLDQVGNSTYGRADALVRAGRRVAWCGDSNTTGTVGTPFRTGAPRIIGTSRISDQSINAGVSGDTASMLLARIPAILAQSPEAAVIMIGTNGSEPLAEYRATMVAIKTAFDAAQVPTIFMTIPPRGSSAGAAVATRTQARNMWLRLWCASNHLRLVDAYSALVDPVTGYLAATYDDGGGLHLSQAGHWALAQHIATAVADVFPTPPWPVMAYNPGWGLLPNPLMTYTATRPTSWAKAAGSAADGILTEGVAAADDGLPAGQWYTVRMDNSAGGSAVYRVFNSTLAAGTYSAGDKLLVCGWAKCSGATASATIRVALANGGTAISPDVFVLGAIAKPGPFMSVVTATQSSGMNLSWIPNTAANADVTHYLGAVDVFNLTTAGLADLTI